MHIRRPEELGALIKSRRHALGWDQQDLANRLGTSRRWVWKAESGQSGVRLDLVLRALNELGIALTASIGESGTTAAGPIDLIDIDAIADTGLDTARPSKPGKRRGR